MFSVLAKRFSKNVIRPLISYHNNYHVAIAGCASPVAQATALLLRNEPSVSKLSLYDVKEQTAGIILDLYNIPSVSALKGYCGVDDLDKALHKADIVIAVGMPVYCKASADGASKSAVSYTNLNFIKELSSKVAAVTPQPVFGISVEPINIMVPYTVELLKHYGKYNTKLVYGITMNDILTAQALLADEKGMDLKQHLVPVIGGHSVSTIVPLVSQVQDQLNLSDKYVEEVTDKIRKAADIIWMGKRGNPPIMSVANGIAEFVRNITRAMDGKRVLSCAYIESNHFGTDFFSGPITIDEDCLPEMQTYKKISERECELLESAIINLRADIRRGKELYSKPSDIHNDKLII